MDHTPSLTRLFHGAITLQDDIGNLFKVNGHHLKLFHSSEDLDKQIDVVNLIDLNISNNIPVKRISNEINPVCIPICMKVL